MTDLPDLFKDWEEKMNKLAFRDGGEYTCKNCGILVNTYEQWVRGMAVCRDCFDKVN